MGRRYSPWPRYIPVAERRQQAKKKIAELQAQTADLEPVEIEGRKIARTFWGEGWCQHLESFSDFANRLPRGRTYVRSGLVCHLAVKECCIEAIVSGKKLYNVKIRIEKLPGKKWAQLKGKCAGQIGSLIELLQGKLSDQVMTQITDRQNGLFPLPGEIAFSCDCPDWADMCKHVAATLYGTGKRLDENPALLFLLRGVKEDELIVQGTVEAITGGGAAGEGKKGRRRQVTGASLEDVFGIDLGEGAVHDIPADGSQSMEEVNYVAARDINNGMITGETVSALRRELGMSQKDFASLLKVTPVTIGNWEKKSGSLKLQEKSRKALINAVARFLSRG